LTNEVHDLRSVTAGDHFVAFFGELLDIEHLNRFVIVGNQDSFHGLTSRVMGRFIFRVLNTLQAVGIPFTDNIGAIPLTPPETIRISFGPLDTPYEGCDIQKILLPPMSTRFDGGTHDFVRLS
jgi:hypothetical protein